MSIDEERLARICEALKRNAIDALACRLPENVVFLSGWWPLTGTSWVIFTASGQSHLIIPACESLEAQSEGIGGFSTFEWAHLKAGAADEQVRTAIRRQAKDLGIDRGKIAIEEDFENIAPPLNVAEPVVFSASAHRLLESALPKANLVDATEVLNGLRVRKTPAEIERLRIANEIAGFGLQVFAENAKAGVSDIELAAAVNAAIMVKGSDYRDVKSARGFAQIASGRSTAWGWRPCEVTTNRQLEPGDVVLLELAVVADGYWADRTRVRAVSGLDENTAKVYRLVKQAQEAAIEKVKPGVKMSDVDKAARDVIDAAGFGDRFLHITGHGIGWRYHEFPPLLAPDVHEPLEEGMVMSVEPGIYIPDRVGVRLEDNVAVTRTGADVLGPHSREIGV